MPSPVCISCGYSLSGLARDDLCPECAFPIARSLDATPLLRTAEPRWLARVASGLRALHRSMGCWLVVVCVWFLFIGLTIFLAGTGSSGPVSGAIIAISAGLMILTGVLGLLFAAYGVWAASAPTPSHHAPPAWSGLILRWCAAPLALLAIVLMVMGGRTISTFGTPFTYSLRAVVQITGLASLLALSRLLQHFELSLPEPRPDLARRVRNTRTNLAVLAIIFIVGWLMTFFSTRPTPPSLSLGMAPLMLAIGFMCFQTTISRTHKAIAAELAAARANTTPVATPDAVR